eukprot:TRINITY_DN41948_c0_g2_i1.p1 TRINITY_DN41948_c0_g2~~TRINITY_DN41948_c0_g2_i1.p1  ORF type:complete len:323 (+),score=91.92 TRINITY_DN41948_c0_g2_i1:468-1436(+)
MHKQQFGQLQKQEPQVRAFVAHALESRTPFYVMALKILLKSPGVFDHLLRKPYWECVDLPEEDAEEYVQGLKEDIRRSWELLKQISLPASSPVKTFEDYANLIGALCLNAVAVKYAHPLCGYIQLLDSGRGGERAKRAVLPLLEKTLQERLRRAAEIRQAEAGSEDSGDGSDGADSESDLEDDELQFRWSVMQANKKVDRLSRLRVRRKTLAFSTRLFPPMKAHGLFPRLAAINHSCNPNAEVFYAGDGNLLLLACRKIKAGDELFISYVDHEEEETKERQKALASYGFICQCPRCSPGKGKRKAPKAAGKGRAKKRKKSSG